MVVSRREHYHEQRQRGVHLYKGLSPPYCLVNTYPTLLSLPTPYYNPGSHTYGTSSKGSPSKLTMKSLFLVGGLSSLCLFVAATPVPTPVRIPPAARSTSLSRGREDILSYPAYPIPPYPTPRTPTKTRIYLSMLTVRARRAASRRRPPPSRSSPHLA